MTASPVRRYLYKAFIMLPFTFLLAPVFYPLLPYAISPESELAARFMPFLVYAWYAIFIYFGMAAALILRKYKYLAYPAILAAAFLASRVTPLLDLQGAYALADGFVHIAVMPDERAYYTLMLFATSALAGCFGAIYTKKTALEFVSRGNTFLFLHLAILGGALHGSPVYLGLFAASYFIARNFILIDRELEVYAEKGVYNTSGTRRIFAYYFSTTLVLSLAPVILGLVVVPFILEQAGSLAGALMMRAAGAALGREPGGGWETERGERPRYAYDGELMPDIAREQLDDVLVYNIMLAVTLIIVALALFIGRKAIWRGLKELAARLVSREALSDYGRNKVINQEIITEIPKARKTRAYKNYLKKSRMIRGAGKRFLLAYSCLFHELARGRSLTPRELAADLGDADFTGVTGVYEDLKYGQAAHGDDLLRDMTRKAESLMRANRW